MQPKIAVIGAGIAGLTAALALSQRGFHVDVIESYDALAEVGAGLQLSPNVTRLLIDLGLAAALPSIIAEPKTLALRSGTSRRLLCELQFGESARTRWHAPYGVAHRTDLQNILAAAVADKTNVRMHMGKHIAADTEDDLLTIITEIVGEEPVLVVGADGVWSSTRKIAAAHSPATFSGTVAWRGVSENLYSSDGDSLPTVTAFLAPGSHLVLYPLGRRNAVNVIAITAGTIDSHEWDLAAEPASLLEHFKGWDEGIRAWLADTTWRRWPLFEVRQTVFSAGARTVLIGDAAHALTPHAAQGAAMAIEDACALAECMATAGGDIEKAIKTFSAARTPRIARVRKRGDFNKFTYQAGGPVRMVRDIVLSLRSPEKLMSDFDWLYGYDAIAAVSKTAQS
ncbi:FAD-dependent oxidoreductase [Hoeflea prorocentri]|uniref:FAD-dependent oxidoreductase n=1 Tax=Hoeflea prorocentri TaxID=1922333 RepID=A0A9X3UFH5_9HYPH|nr:FAD-dependent oxidoreductase [Hoeflea prorocentri]MCY6380388.1 FAD-dependent oxidoreductase [Hoeflea prorocentri]MDA5398188.1 FAD-dependent oxidoreductase [Hoeflea prorocentri]